jgi:hypothetical protein
MTSCGRTNTNPSPRYATSHTCLVLVTTLLQFAKADLAVHKRKVDDVRKWLTEALDGGPLGKLKRYRVCLSFLSQAPDT